MRGAPLNEKRRRQSSDDNDKTIARAAVKRLNVAKMKDVYGSLWCCPKCLHACTHLRPFFLVRSLVLGTIDNLFFFFPKGVKSTVFFFLCCFVCTRCMRGWKNVREAQKRNCPGRLFSMNENGEGGGGEKERKTQSSRRRKKKKTE